MFVLPFMVNKDVYIIQKVWLGGSIVGQDIDWASVL